MDSFLLISVTVHIFCSLLCFMLYLPLPVPVPFNFLVNNEPPDPGELAVQIVSMHRIPGITLLSIVDMYVFIHYVDL